MSSLLTRTHDPGSYQAGPDPIQWTLRGVSRSSLDYGRTDLNDGVATLDNESGLPPIRDLAVLDLAGGPE